MLNFQIHLKLKQVIKIEECHERSIMLTCENTLSTSAVLRGNTAAVLIKCMLLLGYSADKPSFSFN
jgi:hypothetical protein